jgi:dTDP-4-dehydrorhamnose 3,5-epimerase
MRVVPTRLPGPVLIEPSVHGDERGFLVETYRESVLADLGVGTRWVQDNHSRSARGVLRGMHFSVDPGQEKLVRCARGEILDVLVDLRRGSPTHGEWEGARLDDRACRMLYVPRGFAHGFLVLSDVADVVYKCSEYYVAERERAIAYDDPDVGIAWPEDVPATVSLRDAEAPRLRDVAEHLPFTYAGEGGS